VSAFTNGQGRSTGNTYRTVNVAYHLPTNAFVLVVEIFGYDGTDLTTAAMNDVSCGYKVSTNGGGTWGTLGYVDTNGANLYYFFPSVGTLPNGNLFVYFYERDAGDAAQDRDASFREYGTAGTWGTYYISWDTTDNLMMPQSLATTQGANRNRRVGVYLKGANTDGDRSMYLHWSDDGATWQTNGGAGYGPYGPVMSDHDYGTRFVFSTAYQSGYTWIFGHRKVTYDPYGQPNLLAVYDTDFTAAPVPSVDYLTLDSFIHGKQDAVNTTQGGMAKVFIAQNVFTKDVGHDIVGMYVYSGWAAAADVWGPVTEYLSADKTICNAGDVVTIVANVHDWTTGGSNIQSARYYTDVSATLVTMQTFDGSFNSPAEAVVSTTTPISTSGWSTGWHTIYVAGQDAAGNWGAYESIQIYVNAPATPYATATGPTGTSNDQTPDVTYSYGNGPTTVTMYYTTNGGTSWSAGVADATIDGTYTFATLAAGTYHWNARANGEAAPSGAASIEAGPYVIDLTAPNAPTGLTVQHYGMVSSATTHTYTYSGVTAAGGPHDAYFDDLDDQTQAELTTPNSRLELTDGQYSNIVLSDNTYGGIATDSGLNDEYGIEYQYQISEDPATISSINVTHEGYWTQNDQTVTLYALNDAGTWDVIGTTQTFTAATDGTMTRTISATPSNYINPTGVLRVIFAGSARANAGVYIDYADCVVHYTGTAPGYLDNTLNWTASTSPDVDHYNVYRSTDATPTTFNLIGAVPVGTNTYEDNLMGQADAIRWWYRVRAVDAATNEETNVNNVQEPGLSVTYPWQNITVVAGWNLISVNITGTTTLPGALTDLTGGVVWSRVMWYNANDAADPWKQYNTAWASSLNDLTTVTTSMGVWVFVTTVGDGQICVGGSAYTKPVSTDITLYTGWNLVGFPSDDTTYTVANLKSAVTTVTIVERFDGAQTYLTSTCADAYAFVPDQGYWVYTTAPGTWTKTY
jgi:FlaG/FlaF family flagellin (archaellin)